MSDCWESQENFIHHTIGIGAHMKKKVEEKNHKNISAITLFFPLFNWTANCQRQFQLTAGCGVKSVIGCAVCVVVVYFARSLLILPAAKTEKEKKRCELTSLSFVRSHKLYYKTAWTDFFNFSFPTCRPLFLRTWEDRTDMRRSGKKGIQWGSVHMILQIALQFSSQKRRTNMFFRYFPIVSYIFSRHTAQITEKKENSRPRRWDHLSSSLWIYPFLSIYPSRCLEPSQLDSGGGSCKNKHTHIFKSRDCDSTRFSEKVSGPPQPSVDDRNEHSWNCEKS